jgi:phage shock protein A
MPMHANQVDRLKKDSHELRNYIHKLTKKGKTDLAYKITRKQQYLDQQIKEIESEEI